MLCDERIWQSPLLEVWERKLKILRWVVLCRKKRSSKQRPRTEDAYSSSPGIKAFKPSGGFGSLKVIPKWILPVKQTNRKVGGGGCVCDDDGMLNIVGIFVAYFTLSPPQYHLLSNTHNLNFLPDSASAWLRSHLWQEVTGRHYGWYLFPMCCSLFIFTLFL